MASSGLDAASGAGSGAKPTVCFLGPIASYTHQATLSTFPEDKFDLIPVETIKDIFITTQSTRANYGVVPFENSSNGSVVPTLDQFADRTNSYPHLSVCAEIYLDVHHCLLGRASPPSSSVPPPKPLSHIKRIYSHPQALGQCAEFLRGPLRGVETIDVSSTSRAAQLAAADSSGESAAVSSAAAARVLGLDVLAAGIQDRDDNTTRFFVLRWGGGGDERSEKGSEPAWLMERREQRRGVVEAAAEEMTGGKEKEKGDEVKAPAYLQAKSLASFTVPHRHPGALADVLECFRRVGLNLTSINSRPSLVSPFQYVFFVEFEGHRADDPEGRVRDVLRDVAAVASGSRWLGSWDSMK